MRFMHLGDLHIGKSVSGFSMLDDQRYILDSVCDIAERENADAVLISGDVYDRDVPSVGAVEIFDDFIVRLNNTVKAIYIISGNHDSSERLAFAGRLLQKNGVFISDGFESGKHIFNDGYGSVNIYMLPYLRPSEVIRKNAAENSYGTGIANIIKDMDIDKSERNILMAHLFVTSGSGLPELSESEFQSAGTIENVDAAVFDGFNYVALGHLHRPQHIGGVHIRYSGSPIAYSRSEADVFNVNTDDFSLAKANNFNMQKSVPIVDIDGEGNVNIRLIPLVPKRKMRVIHGSIADICRAGARENDDSRNDYIYAMLTDSTIIDNPISKLRCVYPNAMPPVFDNEMYNGEKNINRLIDDDSIDLGVGELFKRFFKWETGEELSTCEEKFIDSIISDMGDDGI